MSAADPQIFTLGDFELESGRVLHDARIVFQTHGTLDADGSNAILYPTWFMGTHSDNEWLIGQGRPLDPLRYFIVVPNILGNGLSTSPSNAVSTDSGADFPLITVRDQVRAQRELVRSLGIARLQAVIGWSLAACQAFQWAVSFPELVERIMPFCGSARTSEHNHVFLDGVAAAIRADGAFADGRYSEQPLKGLAAAGTVYAGWGFSQTFYRQHLYRELGFATRDAFVSDFWVQMFTAGRDANDILSMIATWKSADIGMTPGIDGGTEAALGAITARSVVLSAEQDLYFCVDDEIIETAFIPGCDFRVIPGVWGHSAGVGAHAPDTAFIDAALADLLAS
ncbi:alpha/beta fold hydrolase [uncultured Microbacterium sp.]|uniref:alpha/beta fold hydrolase n=1 Tax=uncultured Microbacterium sp. TaxID=191216 RepID=UPI0035C949EB